MNDLQTLQDDLAKVERQIDREVGQAKALATRAKQDMARAIELDTRAEALEEAIGVLNSFADKRQKEAQQKIEGLVTHGLQTVFDTADLTFHIISEQKARRQESRFVVRSKMGEREVETSILDARGGGVAAVAGFLLRLITTLLRKDVRHLFVLDEAFSMVSAEYESNLVQFVRQLVDKTDAQIILTTHKAVDEWLEAADKAYRFTLKDGRTKVEPLK